MADHVYLRPLNTKSIVDILKKHKVDAVLPTMGGQTALNLCIEADDKGIWNDFDVEIIGVDIDAIQITEDRDKFKQLLKKIEIPVAPAHTANSFLKGTNSSIIDGDSGKFFKSFLDFKIFTPYPSYPNFVFFQTHGKSRSFKSFDDL